MQSKCTKKNTNLYLQSKGSKGRGAKPMAPHLLPRASALKSRPEAKDAELTKGGKRGGNCPLSSLLSKTTNKLKIK
jgi:hypothetical protein